MGWGLKCQGLATPRGGPACSGSRLSATAFPLPPLAPGVGREGEGPALGKPVCAGCPRTGFGRTGVPVSPAAPEKRLQSHRCGLGAAGCSHLDRAGGAGRACGGSGQHREWGRHAEGPARGRGRAGQGRGEGWAGQARRKLRTTWGRPRTDAGPRPWGGGRQGGLCPASGSVGGAGWLRACPQAWPREDLASWGGCGHPGRV